MPNASSPAGVVTEQQERPAAPAAPRRHSRAVPAVGVVLLLGGPTVLAFFAAGYFDGARATAAAVAWGLVFMLAIAGPSPLPISLPARLAIGALAGLAVWSALSVAWAPLVAPAMDNVQRLLLYVAVLLAAVALLRDRRAARAVEPGLALGALLVIGYGLSGRLLPGLIELNKSFGAGGRLEQPITYWNAEGLVAAIGFVLCVRLAGDATRRPGLRAAAAGGAVPLALGIYLSYSRGAVAAAVIGLVVLVAAAPSRDQLRAAVGGLAIGAVASACAAAFAGVASLDGSLAARERDGALMLVVLAALTLAAAALTAQAARAERSSPARLTGLRHAGRLPLLAGVATGLCIVGLVIGGLLEDDGASESARAGPSRFVSTSSLRYEYWRVGLDAFAGSPIGGEGSGSFRVVWRMEREVNAGVSEVHSLFLEMAAELGLPGLLLLLTFLAGVGTAARRAFRSAAPLAPGASAACIVWLLHAAIDWDWQLPAVTLPALVLAGGLLAESERDARLARRQADVNRQRTSVASTLSPSSDVSFLPSSVERAL